MLLSKLISFYIFQINPIELHWSEPRAYRELQFSHDTTNFTKRTRKKLKNHPLKSHALNISILCK